MKSNPLNIKIIGEVIYGNGLGHLIGFPTANLNAADCRLGDIANGVYAGFVTIGDAKFQAIINIGFSPSVIEGGCRRVEAHIFDFNANIYGQTITVEPVYFVRSEQKFPSRDALANQIAHDIATARDMLK